MPDGRIIQQGMPAPVIEHYPDSNGQPMADNDRHYPALQSIRGLLETRYRHHDDVCVTGRTAAVLPALRRIAIARTGRDGGAVDLAPRTAQLPAVGGRQAAGRGGRGQFPGFVPARPGGEAGPLWGVGRPGVFPGWHARTPRTDRLRRETCSASNAALDGTLAVTRELGPVRFAHRSSTTCSPLPGRIAFLTRSTNDVPNFATNGSTECTRSCMLPVG